MTIFIKNSDTFWLYYDFKHEYTYVLLRYVIVLGPYSLTFPSLK